MTTTCPTSIPNSPTSPASAKACPAATDSPKILWKRPTPLNPRPCRLTNAKRLCPRTGPIRRCLPPRATHSETAAAPSEMPARVALANALSAGAATGVFAAAVSGMIVDREMTADHETTVGRVMIAAPAAAVRMVRPMPVFPSRMNRRATRSLPRALSRSAARVSVSSATRSAISPSRTTTFLSPPRLSAPSTCATASGSKARSARGAVVRNSSAAPRSMARIRRSIPTSRISRN